MQVSAVRQAINTSRLSRFQIATIIVCALLNVMDGFDIMAMVFTATAITSTWKIGGTQLGLLLSAGMLGMAVGSVLITPLSDRFGRRRIVVLSLVLIAGGMFFSAHASGFNDMALARVATGLGVGGLIPSLSVIVAEFSSDKWRGGAVSFMGVGYTLGAVLGGIAANALISGYGWRAVFLAGAYGTCALILVVLVWLPESVDFLITRRPANALARLNRLLRAMRLPAMAELPERDAAAKKAGMRALLSPALLPATVMLWAVSFLVLLSTYFVVSWTPRLLALSGLSESQSITGGVLLNAGGLLGCLLFGWLASRMSFKVVTLAYFLIGTASLALFSVVHHDLSIAFPLTTLIGVCLFGAIAGINTLAPSLYDASARGTGVGLATGIGRLGGILSPALTGFMVDAGHPISGLYLVYCVPLLAGAAVMWWMRRIPSSMTTARA